MDMGGDDMDMGDPDDEPMMEDEDIINEVAKRVAARLQADQTREKTVDELAERIMKRLTK